MVTWTRRVVGYTGALLNLEDAFTQSRNLARPGVLRPAEAPARPWPARSRSVALLAPADDAPPGPATFLLTVSVS